MVPKIKFENYKAFVTGTLEIKPITILLGPNSCGKSSLLQLLLMLSQSYEGRRSPNPLQTNGPMVSLGTDLNLVRGRDRKNPLSLTFALPTPQRVITPEIRRNLLQLVLFSEYFASKANPQRDPRINEVIVKLELGSTKGHNKNLSPRVESQVIAKLLEIIEDSKEAGGQKPRAKDRVQNKLMALVKEKNALVDDAQASSQSADALRLIQKAKDFPLITHIKYDLFYNLSSKMMEVGTISLLSKSGVALAFSRKGVNGRRASSLSSDVFDKKLLNKYKYGMEGAISSRLSLESSYSLSSARTLAATSFFALIAEAFNRAIEEGWSGFAANSINHVSPLRAFPQRYYLMERQYASKSIDTRDGASLADVLKRKASIKKKVNDWLDKFGLSVNVQDVRDIIHSIKVRQNKLDLDLTDVGFGVSQILPVIVQGFLAEKGETTLIEQPEIHLHPKMQSELADLFIDIATSTDSSLLIETHSEYLLKRLRRRIADGTIPAEKVAIYLVHGTNGDQPTSRLESVPIGEHGAFRWPPEFLEADLDDVLTYARLQPIEVTDVSSEG